MNRQMILGIDNLTVIYDTEENGTVYADRAVSLNVDQGVILGIIGESGAGKSSLLQASLGLLPPEGRITEGRITFAGQDITPSSYPDFKAYDKVMSTIRGSRASMIFQNPAAYFNPIERIGKQIREVVQNHHKMHFWEADKLIEKVLGELAIPDPHGFMKKYPLELSGGMLQRAMVAMAVVNEPELLIADEPFSALDAETQQVIAAYFRKMAEKGCAVVLILHDLETVQAVCDSTVVMKDGVIVEKGPVDKVFKDPESPYTRELLEMGLDHFGENSLEGR